MQTSIALRIFSVLSQAEIDELFDYLLTKLDNQNALTPLSARYQTDALNDKSAISFACRSKRLALGLGQFAVSKLSGILPSELREIEEGGEYNVDALSKLLAFLKLQIDLVDINSGLTAKPLTSIKEA